MLLEESSPGEADAAVGSTEGSGGAGWRLPWPAGSRGGGSGSGCEATAGAAVTASEPCPPPPQCNCSAQPAHAAPAVQPQRKTCGYGGQPGVWLFPPQLEPNVTLWDSKYKALDPDCEPQPLVQHYIALNRAVHNSTGPTQQILAWSKRKVRDVPCWS